MDAGHRECAVCRRPLDKALLSHKHAAEQLHAVQKNATAHETVHGRIYMPPLGDGRKCKRHVLHDVIMQTLDVMVDRGGKAAIKAIKTSIATFDVVQRGV